MKDSMTQSTEFQSPKPRQSLIKSFLFSHVLPFIVSIANTKIPMPASDKREHVYVPHTVLTDNVCSVAD